MISKQFVPFLYNPSHINVDGSSWAGNFTSKIEPYSSLSHLVPGSNVLAAKASSLIGGSKYNKFKKNNMRIYKMRHTHKKFTKGCKKCITRRNRSRSRSSSRSRSRSRSMQGGNVPVNNWNTGNSLNTTSYRSLFKLSPEESSLASPIPIINTSHDL